MPSFNQREQRIIENLAKVREQIANAARASGRDANAVKMVAVTKYVPLDDVRTIIASGCRDLGESRPQDFWQRAELLKDKVNDIRWHFIGHLQRNKVERTIPHVSLLHSADSERLIKAVNQTAELQNRCLPILLEINISGDLAKHGFSPDEIEPLLPKLATLQNVQISGLMGMASLDGGSDRARRDFAALRTLRERLQIKCPANISLAEISMGMSGDFAEAIAEGATIVRIGSSLFDGTDAGS